MARVAMRPPFSKVWDLSESQTAALLRANLGENIGVSVVKKVSAEAERLLAAVRDHAQRTGAPPNVTEIAAAIDITSKRRLQDLIHELTTAGLVVTHRLEWQGRPRVIEPVGAVCPATGPNVDGSGQEVVHAPSVHP